MHKICRLLVWSSVSRVLTTRPCRGRLQRTRGNVLGVRLVVWLRHPTFKFVPVLTTVPLPLLPKLRVALTKKIMGNLSFPVLRTATMPMALSVSRAGVLLRLRPCPRTCLIN